MMQLPKIYISFGLFDRYLNGLKKGRGLTYTTTKTVRVPGRTVTLKPLSPEDEPVRMYIESFEQQVEIQVTLSKKKGKRGKKKVT